MKKLAIITTHAIQYYAPVFRELAKNNLIELKVFYTWGDSSLKKHDPGFNKTIEWDIPLLDGYEFEFLQNTATEKGTHHFNGIKNPDAFERINDFNPDVILVFGWGWKSHLKIIRYYKGRIPVWFRGDSTLLKPSGNFKQYLKSGLQKIYLTWVYRHIDRAFYVGTNSKAYFKAYGLSEDQLTFAPHAIDNDRFSKDRSKEVLSLRENLDIPIDSILVLFAGKLEEVKNPKLLLDAFDNVDNTSVHLLFVGNGSLEFLLKNNSNKRVHTLAFQNQSEIPVVYQAADLFCLPSLSETWGLAVNEAMACGKAILVSDKVGCAIDLVKPNINGQIFKSEDLQSLKEELCKLLDKQLLIEYGAASKDIIDNWTISEQAKSFIKELVRL